MCGFGERVARVDLVDLDAEACISHFRWGHALVHV